MKQTKDIPQGVQFIWGGSPYRERTPQCRQPKNFDNLLVLLCHKRCLQFRRLETAWQHGHR